LLYLNVNFYTMKNTSLCIVLLLIVFAFKADKLAFQVFDEKGKTTTYDKAVKEILISKPDVILFGELHNSSICHWLELEFARDLYASQKEKLVLGAEMFESDNQVIVNEYLSGKMSDKTFAEEAKVWPNFQTDYKPLLDFAKDNKLQFIASNIPTRYARIVYNKGLPALDSIDADQKKFIAPMPIRYNEYLKCYQDIFFAAKDGHTGPNLPKSQAIKDATMASFILKNRVKGQVFVHYNGTYHSNNNEGIAWYLKQEQPDLKIVVISTVEQDNISKLDKESTGIAKYVICVPKNMTKTF